MKYFRNFLKLTIKQIHESRKTNIWRINIHESIKAVLVNYHFKWKLTGSEVQVKMCKLSSFEKLNARSLDVYT